MGEFRAKGWAHVGCLAHIVFEEKNMGLKKIINLKRVASTEAGLVLYIEISIYIYIKYTCGI